MILNVLVAAFQIQAIKCVLRLRSRYEMNADVGLLPTARHHRNILTSVENIHQII